MRHEELLAEIQREFPRFAIVPKRRSGLQRAIAVALLVVTAGGPPVVNDTMDPYPSPPALEAMAQ